MSTVYVRYANVGLAALAATLALALGYWSDWGSQRQQPSEVLSGLLPKQHSAAFDILPDFRLSGDASAYNGIQQRPLLNPSRAPAPTAPAVVMTEPPKPQIRRGLYELLGVSGIGNTRVAQVRENATRKVLSVRQGDSLQELKVESIGNDRVVLVFQGERDEIQLARFTASSRVPPPPLAVAQPTPQPVAAAIPPPQAIAQTAPVAPALPQQPAVARPTGVSTPGQPGAAAQVDLNELQRRESAAAQNPSNWNRARLESARRRLQEQSGAPN